MIKWHIKLYHPADALPHTTTTTTYAHTYMHHNNLTKDILITSNSVENPFETNLGEQ